jgi:hypothetical protein
MSTVFQIPDKSVLIPISTVFQAQFNNPTIGFYDFTNTHGNLGVLALVTKTNFIYFIDRFSVGGNITEEQFLESITAFPQLKVYRRFKNSNIYRSLIPITNYIDNGELSNFFFSNLRNDQLLFDFSGVLRQLPSMVGLVNARIQVSMNIWEIDDQFFSSSHRDMFDISMGQRNRR